MLRNPLTQINARYLFRYKNPMNFDGQEFSLSFFEIITRLKMLFSKRQQRFYFKNGRFKYNTEYHMKKF